MSPVFVYLHPFTCTVYKSTELENFYCLLYIYAQFCLYNVHNSLINPRKSMYIVHCTAYTVYIVQEEEGVLYKYGSNNRCNKHDYDLRRPPQS